MCFAVRCISNPEGTGAALARFERQENLLRLCMQMQATAEGVSLDDICQTYDVSRRTAERMRDAVMGVFPQIEEKVIEGRQKRWRLPPSTLGRLNDPSLDDMTALNRAAELARSSGDNLTADQLDALLDKLRANINTRTQTRLEPDLAALLEADCVALRPGPREKLNKAHVEVIRDAILAGTCVKLNYHSHRTGRKKKDVELGPLGLLLGNGRQYLVALDIRSDRIKHYALSGIQKVVGTGAYFDKPEGFDLNDFMARGFGIFHEDEQDIEWCFSADIAQLARTYQFHPNQTVTENEDGSLTVKFRSGGLREMCWHLFQWGSFVDVIGPAELIEEYAEQLEDAVEALRTIDE